MADNNQRPVGITFLSIVGFLAGLSNIAVGIFLIVDRDDLLLQAESFHSSGELVAAGVVSIAVGALFLIVAAGLAHANVVMRNIYGVLAALNLASGVWTALAFRGEQRAFGVITAVFAGFVLYLLFNSRADSYFED